MSERECNHDCCGMTCGKMTDWEEMARSIVIDKKKKIKIKYWWRYMPKYDKGNSKVPALKREIDRCRIAMPHLEMRNDPPEYEIALKVIKEVKRLLDGRT